MAAYSTALGFVQFGPEDKELEAGTITEFSIRTPGTDGRFIKGTLWPELRAELEAAGVEVENGDFIAMDGPVDAREVEKDGETKVYLNMNVKFLFVKGTSVRVPEREVKSKRGGKKRTESF